MQDEKLKKLLESLSLKEKIGQLIQLSGDFFTEDKAMMVGPSKKLGIDSEMVELSGSVLNVTGADKVRQIQDNYLKHSRHKIPLLFMADVIYGYKTIYPIPLGIGATWNPSLIQESFAMTAKEAKSAGVHVTFSPMADLVRDARWGRCLESTGEDTWLNSQYAWAMVKGFQGDQLTKEEGIASCVKHFAAYGAAEAGREYNTVDMSERRLREEYLPSYKAAVDAGCEMVMTSFNTVDEIPATANKWLMDDVLRKEWGFEGVIITDYSAILELIAHGVAEDEKEAAYLAMEAGVDIDMKTACYAKQLEPLIKEGKISEKKIDQSVWRILKLKNKLGLFEDSYRGADAALEKQLLGCETHRKQARKVANEAITLLKNENHILPLSLNKEKIALIGPYADNKSLLGLWAVHADTDSSITLRQAFSEMLDPECFMWAKGCEMLEDYSILGAFGKQDEVNSKDTESKKQEQEKDLEEARKIAEKADVIVMALGEHFMQSGEAGSRTCLRIPDIQQRLLDEMKKLGKKIVVLLCNGRPLVLKNVEEKADAMLELWFPGSEGAHAAADIIFGKTNPSGRLTMSFPVTEGQVPVYYNGFNTGRPVETSSHSNRFMSKYLDCDNQPSYPFGYGLSYHEAAYSNFILSDHRIEKDHPLKVQMNIKNSSSVDGYETVQLYIRDLTGSVVRPVKELKGFQKVFLPAYQEKTVEFTITEEMLRFHTKSMEYKSEPGQFEVFIGKNSQEVWSDVFALQ